MLLTCWYIYMMLLVCADL